jgi:hypothetical protein
MTQRSIDQLASELVLLRERRPPKADFSRNADIQAQKIVSEAYRDHMHEEYLLQEEIARRSGPDGLAKAIKRAHETLALLTPQPPLTKITWYSGIAIKA